MKKCYLDEGKMYQFTPLRGQLIRYSVFNFFYFLFELINNKYAKIYFGPSSLIYFVASGTRRSKFEETSASKQTIAERDLSSPWRRAVRNRRGGARRSPAVSRERSSESHRIVILFITSASLFYPQQHSYNIVSENVRKYINTK